eukprot:tig00021428_g21159.t1
MSSSNSPSVSRAGALAIALLYSRTPKPRVGSVDVAAIPARCLLAAQLLLAALEMLPVFVPSYSAPVAAGRLRPAVAIATQLQTLATPGTPNAQRRRPQSTAAGTAPRRPELIRCDHDIDISSSSTTRILVAHSMPQMVHKVPALSLEGARAILAAAEARARELKVAAVFAVADGSSSLVALERLDGAPALLLQDSMERAYAAAGTRRETAALAKGAFGARFAGLGPGGLPVLIEAPGAGGGAALCVGGIGAASVCPEADAELAQAGLQGFLQLFELGGGSHLLPLL